MCSEYKPKTFKVSVQPYCENCSAFEPIVHSRGYETGFYADNEFFVIEHDIHCEHEQKCKRITQFIKEQLKEEENHDHIH